MTRTDALALLAAKGITGPDADTALAAALRGHPTLDRMLSHAANLTPPQVMKTFGQDGGRAVLILRQTKLA